VTASASFHPHRGQGVSRSCLLVWCLFPTLFRSVKLFELSVLFLPLLVAQNVVTLLAVVRGSLWCHHRCLRCTALADPAPARRCSRVAVSWTGVCERREDVGLSRYVSVRSQQWIDPVLDCSGRGGPLRKSASTGEGSRSWARFAWCWAAVR
jgi:hypothetical protein